MPIAKNVRIRKAVIPAGGMGTRLLPITKEIPKEMLPVPIIRDGTVILKPTLQAVFEELYRQGLRQFCFVTGRGKRSIEDHFTPDWSFLEKLGKSVWKENLREFFQKLETSRIYFVNQPARRGFGDAVLHAEEFVGEEPFLVHAGDDFVISKKRNLVRLLTETFVRFKADAVMLSEIVEDPSQFGVIVGREVGRGLYRVSRILEKPKAPPSNLAVIAVYVFSSKIHDAIRAVAPDSSGEVQLTDAIGRVLSRGGRVLAITLRSSEKRVEIGTPESYLESIRDMSRSLNQRE